MLCWCVEVNEVYFGGFVGECWGGVDVGGGGGDCECGYVVSG